MKKIAKNAKNANNTQNFRNSGPIVQWIRTPHSNSMDKNLIHRFPGIHDTFSKVKAFSVKEHERAILLMNGELISEMESGTFELEKHTRQPGTEIIWVDTALHSIPWGIPQVNGIITKDGFSIGLFGELKIKIDKPLYFYKYVVGGAPEWKLRKLKGWIKSLLHSCLKDIFQKYNVVTMFQEKHTKMQQMITGKVIEEFDSYGMYLQSFNILGFKLPKSAEELVDAKKFAALFQNQLLQKDQQQKFREYDSILNRIASLKKRQCNLEDELLENRINTDEFKHKKNLLAIFLEESMNDLKAFQNHPQSSHFDTLEKCHRSE